MYVFKESNMLIVKMYVLIVNFSQTKHNLDTRWQHLSVNGNSNLIYKDTT